MPRILLLAPDTPPAPGALSAGPGIRYAEMAAALRSSDAFEVILAALEGGADAVWTPENVGRLASDVDAVVLPQGHAELGRQVARQLPPRLPVVVDCYAPGLIENILLTRDPATFPAFRRASIELLERGDLFLVANERQHLYTLGLLSAIGRLNPVNYAEPPLMEIPYGVPVGPPPAPQTTVARGVLVPQEAPLAIWYGGIYPWFDAVTAVRGFAHALEEVPDAYLLIVGGRHPRAHAPDRELVRALEERDRLGISERVLEAPWGPYDERTAWYQEADCAICLQHAGIEMALAHRTRLADMLWGRLPFVCSQGDVVGDRSAAAGAAISVPIGDSVAAGGALAALLSDPALRERCRTAAAAAADALAWPVVLAPLVRWLGDPRLATDRPALDGSWHEALVALASSALEARLRTRH